MLFFSIYRDYNCLSEDFVYIKPIKSKSFILFSVYNRFIVIYSLFCIELIYLQYVSIISINSYSNKFFDISCILWSILIYSLDVNVNYFLSYCTFLELNSFNVYALSLYLWCGFKFVNLRMHYYYAIHIFSGSAYTMIDHCFFSMNCYRRYLINL